MTCLSLWTGLLVSSGFLFASITLSLSSCMSAPSAIAQENKSDPTRSSSCPSPPSTDCGVCTIQCGGATRTHANCSKPAVRSCLVSKSHPPTSTTFKPREPRRFFSQPQRGHGQYLYGGGRMCFPVRVCRCLLESHTVSLPS